MTDHSDDHEILDCEAALAEVYTFLDDELTVETRTAIVAHLESCGPCFEAFDFEAELRTVISTRARSDEVPEQLRIRIVERLVEMRRHIDDDGRPPAGA